MRVDEFALELVAADLCQSPLPDASACGQCASCQWVQDQQHPDFRWLRPAAEQAEEGPGEESSSGESAQDGEASGKKLSRVVRIEQVRSLLDFSQLSSHRGGSRWAVIGPVESMHYAAANALLKGLEEPHPSMRFVLYGERLQGVPPTVLSRCRRLTLTTDRATATAQRLAASDASSWLLPLLRQLRVQPSAWAQAAGKTHPQQVIDLLLLWLIDLSRVTHGLAPTSLPGEAQIFATVSRAIVAQRDGPERLARGLAQIQQHARAADHPLNPQLFYETIFEDLRRAAFPTPDGANP
ncbi:MAG: hypothetical protein RLZZ344_1358 [Pseudomonadota bacterium]